VHTQPDRSTQAPPPFDRRKSARLERRAIRMLVRAAVSFCDGSLPRRRPMARVQGAGPIRRVLGGSQLGRSPRRSRLYKST
jgi:hypothetical protein